MRMGNKNTDDNNEVINITDNAEVKKAEFVTDSFSVYTVTWTYNNYKVYLNMHYGYLNDSGEFTEFSENPTKILEEIQANQRNAEEYYEEGKDYAGKIIL